MEFIVLACRVLLSLIFLAAGLAKLADLPGSRKSLVDFGVPAALAAPLTWLLPLGELALAVGLIPRATAYWAGLGSLALLVVFILGLVVTLARGRAPDCHCFGKLSSKPISYSTVARNAVFCLLSLVIIRKGALQPSLLGWAGQFSGLQLAAIFGGSGLCLLLLLNLWLLVQMMQQNGRILLRIEALEGQFEGHKKPEIELPKGNFKGQKTVFLFWNPDCGFCRNMLDDVKAWESSQPANSPKLVVVASGKLRETRAQGFRSKVVHGRGGVGTPSAVLTDEEGNLVSHVAVGKREVMELIQA